jgi:predicted RNA-binding protein
MRYFIFVTSREHVNELEKKNVVQAMQEWKMNKLLKGDKIIIYASKKAFEDNTSYKMFTSFGTIQDDEHKKKTMTYKGKKLTYFQKPVKYHKTKSEVDIYPLLKKLKFVKKSKSWGLYLISGFREIYKEDYELIKKKLTTKTKK